MSSSYYVESTASNQIAQCSYFTDPSCTSPYTSSPIQSQGDCSFTQGSGSTLQLIGAVFKTLNHATGLTTNNFTPAAPSPADSPLPGQPYVSIPLKTSGTTKGVVLLFADKGMVTCLYPSTDPQVQNDE